VVKTQKVEEPPTKDDAIAVGPESADATIKDPPQSEIRPK